MKGYNNVAEAKNEGEVHLDGISTSKKAGNQQLFLPISWKYCCNHTES